jgi:dolichol-phosphate mannosyltransferase
VKSAIHRLFYYRNHGHQLAVSAGLAYAKSQVLMSDGDWSQISGDFHMNFFAEGYDVIYAIRKNRKESFQKLTYSPYYRLQKNIQFLIFQLTAVISHTE